MKRSHPLQTTTLSTSNKIRRTIWGICWVLLYRPSPALLHGWRRMLLRLFGARIDAQAHPYPRARIWAPWNLHMGAHSCLANDVDCYCVAPITLGVHATISQYSYLCSASHDYHDPSMPLIAAAITIADEAWVAADVFVGPGVNIGEGAVIGARSTVIGDIPAWTFVAGSPAQPRGTRTKFERSTASRP
jgi:putative colanic acid biosynthesis acetyltransferase WcaF